MDKCGNIQKRWLLYHAESDSLVESLDEVEMEHLISVDGCMDVTDDERAEKRFKDENGDQ